MITAVANDKGGVGKTTTSVYLAHEAAKDGPTLIVDSDPSHSAWNWQEVCLREGRPFPSNLEVMKLTGDVHKVVPTLASRYKHIFIDSPPNDEKAITSALLAAPVVLVPLGPSTMDTNRLTTTIEILSKIEHLHKPDVYVLVAKVDRRAALPRQIREWLTEMGFATLDTQVPLQQAYLKAFGDPVRDTKHYRDVFRELKKALKDG